MGRGDDKTGGRENDSILSDTLEALIASVYLDGGYSDAKKMIEKHFYHLIQGCSTRDGIDDFKSVLQERCQAEIGLTPTYRVMDEWGREHSKSFHVAVFLSGEMIGEGTGANKREAAQNAAKSALESLEVGGVEFR
jgi:ribonuclease-3